MNGSDIVRARRLPDGTVVQVLPDGSTQPFEDRTDWARLEAMTEEEIEANALSDPDNPPLTDEELARMRPGSVSSPRHDKNGTGPIDIAPVPARRVTGRSKRAAVQVLGPTELKAAQKSTNRLIVSDSKDDPGTTKSRPIYEGVRSRPTTSAIPISDPPACSARRRTNSRWSHTRTVSPCWLTTSRRSTTIP